MGTDPRRPWEKASQPPRKGPKMPPHPCPCGCGKEVPGALYACKEGWFRLPRTIRNAIQLAYRRQPGGPGHLAAMNAGRRWYANNPRVM